MIDADGKDLGYIERLIIPTGQCMKKYFIFSPGDTGFKVSIQNMAKLVLVYVGINGSQNALEFCLKGAEILLYPTAIGSEPVLVRDSMPHWRNTMCGHAAANIIPVCASNRVGEEKAQGSAMIFQGFSFIANQYGEVVEEMNRTEEGFRIHEFDLNEIDKEKS